MEKTGKSGPLIETDLEFLGYHDVEKKDAQDFGLHQQRCRVFEAHIRAGITEHTHWFVYLLTGCLDEDIRNVEDAVLGARSIFTKENCFIVIPESMSGRNVLKRLEDEGRIYIFEDLMWKKIQHIFSGYIEEDKKRIENLQAEHYVEPQVEEERGATWSLQNFSNMLSGKGTGESVVVIKADAGVGKTTLAAKIASELADQWKKSRVVPLLLTGQTNWRELSERAHSATNLGDILISLLTMKAGEAEFPLRRSEEFARIIQLGYFAFIFDGFDELAKSSGVVPLVPQENFNWLASIAKDSNTRIMLTTRPSFWNREIDESVAKEHKLFRLKPFDSKNVSKYFDQYFSGKENSNDFTQKAKKFYSDLRKSQGDDANEYSFFNLPACAMMIADQVEKGGDDYVVMTDKTTQQNSTREFFLQILRRENKRQQTQTEAETMHEVFENIAITSSEFELNDIATDPKCEIQPEDIDKIADHAFLEEINNRPGKFLFKIDFLRHYLQASHIRRFIMGKSNQSFQEECKRNKDLRVLIEAEADGSGHLSERVAHALDMQNVDKVVGLHKACVGRGIEHSLKSFLFHIIAKTVISRSRGGESRRERGDTILSLLGDGSAKRVANLHVRGALGEIYLNGWEIRDSSFVDFSLTKGSTQSDLRFVNCKFSGSLELPNDSRFENCTSSETAKLVLNKIGSVEITKEDIRKNLETVLSRFWIHGRLRVRTILEDDWKTGKTTGIEQCYGLLEILKQEDVVEKHEHYRRLQIKRNAINDVKEFMENGMTQRRVQAVLERMGEKIHASK